MISGTYLFKNRLGMNSRATENDAYLKAFAEVDVGDEVVLFRCRGGDLLDRTANMKEQLVKELNRCTQKTSNSDGNGGDLDMIGDRIAGALMVYCAGVRMALSEKGNGQRQLQRLSNVLASVFGGKPYMAMHPFGEQGFNQFRNRSVHGNLTFAALVFSLDPPPYAPDVCSAT